MAKPVQWLTELLTRLAWFLWTNSRTLQPIIFRQTVDFGCQCQLLEHGSEHLQPSRHFIVVNVLSVTHNCRASDTATEQHTAPRKANIRPIASHQPHIRSVQPVRSSATETRAMASIRPMAASVLSSVSSVSTPMATVMPTTATVSDSKSLAFRG